MAMIRAACLALLLTGCAAPAPQPIRDTVFIHLRLVDAITLPGFETRAGVALCTSTGLCEIQIRRDCYPECVEHEVRHALEGSWHDDRPTTCR